MTYKELIEECKKRELTIVDDNGKFSVLDKKGKKLSKIKVDTSVFGVTPNKDAVYLSLIHI